MKNTVLAAMLSMAFLGTGCLNNNSTVEPEIIVDPTFQTRVSSDTITSGEHLGIRIAANAENVYAVLQNNQGTIGHYVHVVSNIFTNVSQLDNRIHLYQSILLDEKKGTDSGVQIAFEEGKVKSIYLNSGKQLTQWPLKENASTSVRVGDQASALYDKLVNIHKKSSYANKFERISLFTKELVSQYDSIMSQSPEWYFRYTVEPKLYEHIEINIENGMVKYLIVSRYRDPS